MLLACHLVGSIEPEWIEAYSIAGSVDKRNKYCYFKSVTDLNLYMQHHGLLQYMKARAVKEYKKEGYTQVTYTSPVPLGNPFLLQYNLFKDGSGVNYAYNSSVGCITQL